MTRSLPIIPTEAAARLLIRGAGLCSDPATPCAPASALRLIRDLGFVQLDSIHVVERAHHHILWTRRHTYRPSHLEKLQASGKVFEHWTHDASIIPSEHFPHWKHRMARVSEWQWSRWLHRKLGPNHEAVIAAILQRVRAEGAVMARDFDHPEHKSGKWWDWKPSKAALEYLWRAGVLTIPRREGFQKVYDLSERVLPDVIGLPMPDRAAHVEWCCSEALSRLGVATPKELAAFHASVSSAEASAWCKDAVARGDAIKVSVEGRSPPRPTVALPNWKRLASSADPPEGIRLLSPFDPIIRDRDRCERLFGFAYRFEAFTPAPKRRYGYYVLPILETRQGTTRLVGRLDPELDRARGVLGVRKLWWEKDIHPDAARLRMLTAALEAYAAFNQARFGGMPKAR